MILPPSYRRREPSSEGLIGVGYLRVSTDAQARGVGVEAQRAAVETYSRETDTHLLEIIEESHTATDGTPLLERPGFQRALGLALQSGCPILVSRMDRVSRNLRVFRDFSQSFDVVIIPVCEVDVLERPGQRARIAEAEATARIKYVNQMAVYDRMRAEGKMLGNPNPSELAHRQSAKARQSFAGQRIEKIATVIEEVGVDISRRELVDELNRRGIATGHGREWTPDRLKRDHAAALDLIEWRLDERAKAEEERAAQEAEQEEMRKLPMFGLF
ncbi:recombinase family protein [Paracoccus subflavus]|uniref:Recombinase family protein n=1 Tax=Paracoccus subflavus TaxID=2528244 RepID=A0A4Q9FWN3_9RHOB|nr:recombinase family protein [Paracoccus subflavus]TBN37714.1 recombinase family protein [Paracoccus subflavus]